MEKSKLSRDLRLLAVGQIVGLVGALGMLASSLLMMTQVLSDRPANPMGPLRLSVLLLLVSSCAVIASTVVNLVAQVKLRREHPDYRLALILTLVGVGVNILLSLLKLDGFLPKLLPLVISCGSLYLTVRATNEFLTARGCDKLVHWGWRMLTIYFVIMPFNNLMTWWLQQSLTKNGLADSIGLIIAVSAAAVILSLVPGLLLITYFRASSRKLESVGLEEPPALDTEIQ